MRFLVHKSQVSNSFLTEEVNHNFKRTHLKPWCNFNNTAVSYDFHNVACWDIHTEQNNHTERGFSTFLLVYH